LHTLLLQYPDKTEDYRYDMLVVDISVVSQLDFNFKGAHQVHKILGTAGEGLGVA